VQVLNFNIGINFGADGNLKEFDPVGFSPTPDDVSTWSQASVAELLFRLPPLRHDIQFTIEVFPFLVKNLLSEQSCWVFFNGLFVHYHVIQSPVKMTFAVSSDFLNPRANRMSFALPDATSPKDLSIGNDVRLLGLSFVKLTAGPPSTPGPERGDAEPAAGAASAAPMATGPAAGVIRARPGRRG
jgi:hypothetical protein